MFKIYRFIYVDKKQHIKWEIFARTAELADKLADSVTNLGVYKLQRARIGFSKLVMTEYPPYELEQVQEEYVQKMELKQHIHA